MAFPSAMREHQASAARVGDRSDGENSPIGKIFKRHLDDREKGHSGQAPGIMKEGTHILQGDFQ